MLSLLLREKDKIGVKSAKMFRNKISKRKSGERLVRFKIERQSIDYGVQGTRGNAGFLKDRASPLARKQPRTTRKNKRGMMHRPQLERTPKPAYRSLRTQQLESNLPKPFLSKDATSGCAATPPRAPSTQLQIFPENAIRRDHPDYEA